MENQENKESEIDIVELLKVLWKRRGKIVLWGAIGFVVGVIIAISIPKTFNTTVKIAPEEVAKSGLGGMGALAGMVGIDISSGSNGITSMIYPEIVKSTPFLLEFANIEVEKGGEKMTFYRYITKEQDKPWWSYIASAPGELIGLARGLFADPEVETDELSIFKPSEKQNNYIKSLTQNISISTDKKTNIFTISVNMQDPLIAAVIADSLMSKLQVYMTDYRTNKSRKDLVVKSVMLEEARNNYYAADDALAESLDINRNIITKKGQVKINRLTEEKDLAFTIYQELATQVELAKIKLQDETPIATIIEPTKVAARASSPKKALIAIAFAFLGGMIISVMTLYKEKVFSL